MMTLPLYSFTRTVPVTCLEHSSMAFCSMSRSGLNQKPLYSSSAYRGASSSLRCAWPRSRHRLSIARRAWYSTVPPGVSYTPRDFIPTKRDSTMSMRPTPLSPPNLLSAASMLAGLSFSPSIATGSPASNSMSTYVGSSGAFSGDTDRVNMASSASTHGSSSALPSYEMCSRLASIENGGSSRLPAATGMLFFSAYSIRLVRELSSQSRHGATTLTSGMSP
mmetsp:Transcript_16413/g.51001  ORF Transcript_16413/g.51001 Transcript_16413/m.51001 type:complete len:221 (+) Transcript_16413:211-873(+)